MFWLFQYESALAVDAIEVITRTLKSMLTANKKIFKSTFRRKEVYNYNRTKGVPCTTNPPIPWMHGDAIMDEIKRVIFKYMHCDYQSSLLFYLLIEKCYADLQPDACINIKCKIMSKRLNRQPRFHARIQAI